MYSTPELFHEMLVALFNYSQSQGFVTTCHSIRGYYSGAIAGFATSGIAPPHVVIIEASRLCRCRAGRRTCCSCRHTSTTGWAPTSRRTPPLCTEQTQVTTSWPLL
jgi:hypothetical protein